MDAALPVVNGVFPTANAVPREKSSRPTCGGNDRHNVLTQWPVAPAAVTGAVFWGPARQSENAWMTK
jgi:hypothetical protein